LKSEKQGKKPLNSALVHFSRNFERERFSLRNTELMRRTFIQMSRETKFCHPICKDLTKGLAFRHRLEKKTNLLQCITMLKVLMQDLSNPNERKQRLK
jgi:hypothetical protein